MKYVSYLFGALCAIAAGAYLIVYLYRWEWQRAIVCGILFLAIEGFLVLMIVLSKVARVERRVADADSRVEEVRRRLEESRDASPAGSFRWLAADPGRDTADGTSRTFVFVPILMVTGAALSGIAWVIQRIAAATTRPGAERRLAGRLAPLAAPPGGVRGPLQRMEDVSAVPRARPLRALLVVAGSVGAAVLLVFAIHAISDATETREEARPDAAATTVVFKVEVRGTSNDTTRGLAARDLWETCRRSTAAVNPAATLGALSDDGVYAGVIRPAISPHDVMRLRGCLSDVVANRATATVLGDGQAGHTH